MVQPTSISPASDQTRAMAATRRGLALLPLETKLEILAYIFETQAHQIVPSPLLQMSRCTRRTALRQLTHNITLQLDIHHASYSRFWEVSFTSATAPILRSPSQPHLIGKTALWPHFRPHPVKRLRGEEMNAMMHKKMHELEDKREKKRAAAEAARMKKVSLVVRFR